MRWLLAFAVILVIILKVWPRGLWFVLAAALLLGAGAAYLNSQEEAERALVRIDVLYAPQACPAEKPLQVTLRNNGSTPLDRVLFSIHARRPGYSGEVTPYSYKQYDSSKILQPGESHAACYSQPVLARSQGTAGLNLGDLEWFAETDKAYFQ